MTFSLRVRVKSEHVGHGTEVRWGFNDSDFVLAEIAK